jgi:hypothetical protein
VLTNRHRVFNRNAPPRVASKIPDIDVGHNAHWLNTGWGRQALEDEGIFDEKPKRLASTTLSAGSNEAVEVLLNQIKAKSKTREKQAESQQTTKVKAQTTKRVVIAPEQKELKVKAPVQQTKLEAIKAIKAFKTKLIELTPNQVGRNSKSYRAILDALEKLEGLVKKNKLKPEELTLQSDSIIIIQNSLSQLYCESLGIRNAVTLHDFVTRSETMFTGLIKGIGQQLNLSDFKETILKPILSQVKDFKDRDPYSDSNANKAATYDFLSVIKSEDPVFNKSLNMAKKSFDVKDSLKIFKLMKSDPERFLYVLRQLPPEQVIEPSAEEKEKMAQMIELYASDETKNLIKEMYEDLKTDEKYKGRHYSFIAAIISFCKFITFNSDARLAQNIKDAFTEVVKVTDIFGDIAKVEATTHTKALLDQRSINASSTQITRE